MSRNRTKPQPVERTTPTPPAGGLKPEKITLTPSPKFSPPPHTLHLIRRFSIGNIWPIKRARWLLGVPFIYVAETCLDDERIVHKDVLYKYHECQGPRSYRREIYAIWEFLGFWCESRCSYLWYELMGLLSWYRKISASTGPSPFYLNEVDNQWYCTRGDILMLEEGNVDLIPLSKIERSIQDRYWSKGMYRMELGLSEEKIRDGYFKCNWWEELEKEYCRILNEEGYCSKLEGWWERSWGRV